MHNSLYDLKAFGNKVYDLRTMSKMTQSDIRKKTGIHEQTLRRIEYGETFPSLETIEKISSAMGYNLVEILSTVRAADYDQLKAIYDELDHISVTDETKDIPDLIQKIDDYQTHNHIYDDIFNKKKDQLRTLCRITELTQKNDAMSVTNTEMLCIMALALSHPNFNPSRLKDYYFTPFESRILLTLGFCYHRQDKDKLAMKTIDYSVENIRLHLKINPSLSDLMVHALLAQSYLYFVLNDLDKAIDICTEGIQYAKDNYSMKLLPHLYCRRGVARYKLDQADYQDDLRLGLTGFKLNGMEDLAKKYEDILLNRYKIVLDQ